jgi:hypothetical protein
MFTLRSIGRSLLVASLLAGFTAAASHADINLYTQNFETIEADSADALANDGWVVYGNVYTPEGAPLYGYGTFPAPNGGDAFSAVDTGQGGPEQGTYQLSVYNDYNNVTEHTVGNLVEANVFHEDTIGVADVGKTYTFQFDAKLGNLDSISTAVGFIKTIDPANNYAQTNFVTEDMTNIPATWGTYHVSLFIDSGLVGQLFQFGFSNTTTYFLGSGVFYDNLVLREATTSSTPVPPVSFTLHQNVPNPFNPSTSIAFELQRQEHVLLRVFDTAGRRVATLLRSDLGPGPHAVTWNGRTANGDLAAAGIYHYVLETSEGRSSRSMVLVK